MEVQLYEYDEDSPEGRLEPSIVSKHFASGKDPNVWYWGAPERNKPALQIDLVAISIFEIKSVEYEYDSYKVRHSVDKTGWKYAHKSHRMTSNGFYQATGSRLFVLNNILR